MVFQCNNLANFNIQLEKADGKLVIVTFFKHETVSHTSIKRFVFRLLNTYIGLHNTQ